VIKIFTDKEKKVIKTLVKEELTKFTKEESSIIEKSVQESKIEGTYEDFLKNILKKLK
jgi:hypothetical protein